MDIQSSRYIKVDLNSERIHRQRVVAENLKRRCKSTFCYDRDDKLNLRFCNEKEVQDK